MPQDHRGPDPDRLIVARLTGTAQRHARWGALDEDEKAAGAAELREVAGDRPDLLAEVAGLALGSAERKGPEYEARGQAVAELCRMAGADEALIPQWIEQGRRRAEAAKLPPIQPTLCSAPGRALPWMLLTSGGSSGQPARPQISGNAGHHGSCVVHSCR